MLSQHPVGLFIATTFFFSYVIGLPVLLTHAPAAATGTSLLALYLSRALVTFGPTFGAVVAAWFTDRKTLSHLREKLRPHVADIPLAASLIATSLLLTIMASLLAGVQARTLAMAFRHHFFRFVLHVLFQVLFIGIGEEVGWRGWLLPRLLERFHRGIATVLVGLIWAVWHLPVLFGPPGNSVIFVIGLIALSFLFTRIWNFARGSLFVMAVAHASLNAPLFFMQDVLSELQLSINNLQHIWMYVLMSITLLALVSVLANWRWWHGVTRPHVVSEPLPAG